jgi:hypothetical protein
MPPPKSQGTKPVSVGIKKNRAHNFYVVYKCFNTKNTPDYREFFLTEEEAQQHFNTLI